MSVSRSERELRVDGEDDEVVGDRSDRLPVKSLQATSRAVEHRASALGGIVGIVAFLGNRRKCAREGRIDRREIPVHGPVAVAAEHRRVPHRPLEFLGIVDAVDPLLAFALKAQPEPGRQRPRLVVVQDQAVDPLLFVGMLAHELGDRLDETIFDVAVQRLGRRAVPAGAIEHLLAAVTVLAQLKYASERVIGGTDEVRLRSGWPRNVTSDSSWISMTRSPSYSYRSTDQPCSESLSAAGHTAT